jgi:hypothetical protein
MNGNLHTFPNPIALPAAMKRNPSRLAKVSLFLKPPLNELSSDMESPPKNYVNNYGGDNLAQLGEKSNTFDIF